MKRFYSILVLSTLLALPAMGSNCLITNELDGGTRTSGGTVGSGGSSSVIPAGLAEYILNLAAPQFGISPRWLIIQYGRGNVTITEIGQNLYAVTYGGITIQILIESGSNWNSDAGRGRPALRN